MPAVIEVKYFNTFLLKKIVDTSDDIVWNGSFGIPQSIGGYPFQSLSQSDNNWVIEESRIRGGFNNTNVDYGVKAYIVEDEPKGTRRFNALIYSGIFNSRTGINRTNVFSVAEDITKAADPANGSIQKLYAEDTNLNIFQELKVSRALIDKDAIYSAEGGGTVTASNLVIGVIQPYAGKYGIAKNPESFAAYGFRKYFADINNGVVLRLSQSGIEEISSFGMKDFFRDELAKVNNSSGQGKVIGSYDIYGKDYTISLQSNNSEASTLNFDERAKGWVSFFSYAPDQMFSLRNNFYSVKTDTLGNVAIWRHYDQSVNRGNFYGVDNKTSITFVLNPNPTNSKTFNTIAYQGSNGWQLSSFISDPTGTQQVGSGVSSTFLNNTDASSNSSLTPFWGKSYTEGEYVLTEGSGTTSQASNTNSVVLNNFTGVIRQGNFVAGPYTSTGPSVTNPTKVVSFNSANGLLVLDNDLNVSQGTVLTFSGTVSKADYFSVFGTISPPLNRYHAGFVLKENKYTSYIVNNSTANPGEIVFGNQISGIKGFYAVAELSTDNDTDPGGEKTLFAVESNYTINNGY